ncbi:hypothetical protein DENSPDRAFT_839159 [Dentipellis sp. KUC8613]|nr:hypothetical protein DENSPDRAFT_839159 [Dentipellis sp. KUC8613]
MEKVQFQQEQMLSELKDLAQKGLFTQKEIKQIMKKRTAFETALVRRVAKKADYLRYAAYEMQLEALRKKRVERLNLPPAPPSISDYALVRRQFYIFERALKKFKSDIPLWVQYIQVAKREGARALVGRITARALQLHPNTPALYILAASHELEHLSPSAARTLLQRGIRLNADSVELWREYVKMELGFIEGLRRRWDLLGITLDTKGKGKEKAPESPNGGDDGENDESHLDQEAGEGMQIDEEAVDEGDAARQAILDGAIVKSVISSAAKALPRIELFTALQQLLSTYPIPGPLRAALLDYLHELLKTTLPKDAAAVKLYATRALAGEVEGEELISGLRSANEELQHALKEHGAENAELYDAYAAFVEDWCRRDIDDDLKTYLISSLHALIRASAAPAPAALLAAHVVASLGGRTNSPEKTLRAARKYTKVRPGDARVWRARLGAEKTLGEAGAFETAWADARHACTDEDVWLFGLDGSVEQMDVLERLMKESLRDAALAGVHEALLMRYGLLLAAARAEDTIERVRRVAREALPTARVWAAAFGALSEASAGEKVLEAVYEEWREKDLLEATLAWAAWLLGRGSGQAAKAAVMRARGMLGETGRAQLDGRWTGLCA